MIYLTIPPPTFTTTSSDEVGPPPYLKVHSLTFNHRKDFHCPNRCILRNKNPILLTPHQWQRVDLPVTLVSSTPCKYLALCDTRLMYIRQLSQEVICHNSHDFFFSCYAMTLTTS